MGTIAVAGAIAGKPWNGGEAWVRLSWALGLARFGFDVVLVEEAGGEATADREYFERVVSRAGIAGAALLNADGVSLAGLATSELLELAELADLLVNISGNLRWRPLFSRFRLRVYLDIDPGFTQVWHARGWNGLAGHHRYFTIAENIGSSVCSIPTNGIRWQTTRQPVVLDDWPVREAEPGRFTTVASWRCPYGPLEHEGRRLGLKLHEWRKFAALPERSGQTFEAALAIDPAEGRDLELLRGYGWRLVDPGAVAGDPDAFRRYVQGSAAEFSVAQGVYVETASGWFSDRTTRYLASGKPALVQDTGFGRRLPVGDGLVPFHTLQEAVAGTVRIARDYDAHCRAARAIAAEHFDSGHVLRRFLEEVDVSP
jgi:hypothetical protein